MTPTGPPANVESHAGLAEMVSRLGAEIKRTERAEKDLPAEAAVLRGKFRTLAELMTDALVEARKL